MKNSSKPGNFLQSVLLIAMLFAAYSSNAQQAKPSGSGYVTANGAKVYYEVYGEGRPIVLLHGAFMTINTNWGELIPELSKTRKVIAVELQGHGHTPYSDRKLSHAILASDVEKVLDYLKIDSADVAGFSFGGSVAYEFAIQSPKRVKKLVIISSTYKSSGWLPVVSNALKQLKPEMFDGSPMKEAYDAVAPDKTKWTKFLEQMFALAGAPFDFGDANISKITAPVMIIAGDNDGLDKIELAKTFQLLGGNVSVEMGAVSKSQLAIVPAQGHVSLMMQTTILLTYLNSFLQ